MEEDGFSQLLAIVFCLIGSALFSATETALTSLSHSRVHQLLDSGKKSSLLGLWLVKPNHVLTTILIGNNVVNILASALATKLSYQYFQRIGMSDPESIAVAAAVGSMTFVILVFGEVVPKTYAKHNAETLIPFFMFTYVLYFPFLIVTNMLVYVSRAVVRISGGKFKHEGPLVTEEDLEWMIRRGTEEKSLDGEVGDMLAGALDLQDKKVREIMVPRTRMIMFEVNENLEELWEHHRDHNYSRYPVYDEIPDRIVGIFYIKDLLQYLIHPHGRSFQIRELMRTDLYFVPESKNVHETLTELKRRRIGLGIVVDEFGGVSGMISLEDIIEEMVGEIYDEFDEPAHDFVEESPGRFRVQALYPLSDLEDHLPFRPDFPPDKGYDTVGGLLLDLADKVPQTGDVLYWPKKLPSGNDVDMQKPMLIFTILAASETRIDTVRMEFAEQKADTTLTGDGR